jgi:hypothetical protein
MLRKAKIILCICLLFFVFSGSSQLKFIIEDFEGLSNTRLELHENGIFDFGSFKIAVANEETKGIEPFYIQERYLKIERKGSQEFGGWGKGISLNVDLNASLDLLNFYFLCEKPSHLKITLQEDDNGSGAFEKEADDIWICPIDIETGDPVWRLISVPLGKFTDENKEGDGTFNCNYKEGKLLTFIISYENPNETGYSALFDFVCFSEGKLLTDPAGSSTQCALGLWSEEGNKANFSGISETYKKLFGTAPVVVHLFQSFSLDGGQTHNINTSLDKIEKLIDDGYIPMITLEDHYIDPDGTKKNIQPNLYSIIEGHYDFFFIEWAKQIKQLNGTVLVRILHEFNGDWYPWCIAKNDKDPQLFIKTYRHIRNIFDQQDVSNAKFIWCPNSMSLPQASWNFILNAYPGSEYVDIIGCDIYNGSGANSDNWRSFRKEAIETYFLAAKHFPTKPFIVCETASRERNAEDSKGQNKSEWIEQMSTAARTDLSRIMILTWFNEKESFKLNSSPDAKESFLKYLVKDEHFNVNKDTIIKYLK